MVEIRAGMWSVRRTHVSFALLKRTGETHRAAKVGLRAIFKWALALSAILMKRDWPRCRRAPLFGAGLAKFSKMQPISGFLPKRWRKALRL
jgi:hypothetical protein